MKKRFTAVFTAAIMALSAITPVFGGVSDVRVNDASIDFGDVQPQIIEDYMYVPIRSVFEKMGTVDWDAETKAVIITDENNELILYTKTGEIHLNGQEVEQYGDAPTLPVIENGTTLLPVRSIAETFGAAVNWDEDNNSLDIYTVAYGLEKLQQLTEGKPLPQAVYECTKCEYINDSSYNNGIAALDVLLKYSDTEGYEALADSLESTKLLPEDMDDENYEAYQDIFCSLCYEFMNGLSSLEDKSFMTDFERGFFENPAVQTDEGLSVAESINAVREYSAILGSENEEEIANAVITVNPKLEILAKFLAVYANPDTNFEDIDFETAMGYFGLLGGYMQYLTDNDPEIAAFAELYEELSAIE